MWACEKDQEAWEWPQMCQSQIAARCRGRSDWSRLKKTAESFRNVEEVAGRAREWIDIREYWPKGVGGCKRLTLNECCLEFWKDFWKLLLWRKEESRWEMKVGISLYLLGDQNRRLAQWTATDTLAALEQHPPTRLLKTAGLFVNTSYLWRPWLALTIPHGAKGRGFCSVDVSQAVMLHVERKNFEGLKKERNSRRVYVFDFNYYGNSQGNIAIDTLQFYM
jgi:hypothetical protein